MKRILDIRLVLDAVEIQVPWLVPLKTNPLLFETQALAACQWLFDL
jgi:hypothetical protein